MGEICRQSEASLAEDGDGSVASAHLSLGDHIQHLHHSSSGDWSPMLWPVCQLELCHYHSLSLAHLYSLPHTDPVTTIRERERGLPCRLEATSSSG